MTPAADAWIDALLASTTYIAQRGLTGRGAPDDPVVRALVAALAARGGRLSRIALAQALQLPAFRASGLVNAARRVLNVDQAQVLSIDATTDEVVLNMRLLRPLLAGSGGAVICAPNERFAIDSPLEGDGSEPSVPRKMVDV